MDLNLWPLLAALCFLSNNALGKGDRFFGLLEDAAQEAHESVRFIVQLIKSPRDTRKRRKEKKISEQISEELMKPSSPAWRTRTSRRSRGRSTGFPRPARNSPSDFWLPRRTWRE